MNKKEKRQNRAYVAPSCSALTLESGEQVLNNNSGNLPVLIVTDEEEW